MVKRSLLVTLILVVLYALFIKYFDVKPIAQYKAQDNLIRSENYMYNDSVRKSDLIIGTSISAKINEDKLPKGVILLAGAGFSVYDGMALILETKAHPKYVFIEQNAINQLERPDFITYLFNAPDYYRKKYIVSMRDQYQPAAETYQTLFIHTAPRITWFTHYIFNPFLRIFCKGKPIPISAAEYYEDAKMRNNVDTNFIKEAFVRLQEKVSALEKGGTKVCFYGVPNAPEIYYGKACQTILNYFPRYFPPSKYTYLPHPDIYQYHTIDQIHMDDTSITKFTYDLVKKIEIVKNRDKAN